MKTHLILACLALSGWSLLVADDSSGPEEASTAAATEELTTVDALWAAYLAANGGRQQIEAVQSIQIEGHIHMPGEAPAERLAFRIIRKRLGLLRQRITFPSEVAREVLVNDRGVWAKFILPNGEERSQEVGEREQVSLRRTAAMESPFLQAEGRPDWLRLRGLETIELPDGEIEAYAMEVLPKSGLPFAEIYLSPDDFQERKVVMRPTEASQDRPPQTVFYGKHAQVDGVHYPRALHFHRAGQLQQRVEIERLRTNLGLFDSYFEETRFLETTKPLESDMAGGES